MTPYNLPTVAAVGGTVASQVSPKLTANIKKVVAVLGAIKKIAIKIFFDGRAGLDIGHIQKKVAKTGVATTWLTRS